MIIEDYCSFEVAKLLKEKGFHENVNHVYHYYTSAPFYRRHLRDFNGEDYKNLRHEHYSAPTLQMVMKWLREVHEININILYDLQRFVKTDKTIEDVAVYEVDIITKNSTIYIGNYNHYESACEAAIKYCLTNQIK